MANDEHNNDGSSDERSIAAHARAVLDSIPAEPRALNLRRLFSRALEGARSFSDELAGGLVLALTELAQMPEREPSAAPVVKEQAPSPERTAAPVVKERAPSPAPAAASVTHCPACSNNVLSRTHTTDDVTRYTCPKCGHGWDVPQGVRVAALPR